MSAQSGQERIRASVQHRVHKSGKVVWRVHYRVNQGPLKVPYTFNSREEANEFVDALMEYGEDAARQLCEPNPTPKALGPSLLEVLVEMHDFRVNLGLMQPSTRTKNMKTIYRYFGKAILSRPLNAITPRHLHAWVDAMTQKETIGSIKRREKARLTGKEEPEPQRLSSKTIKNAFDIVKSAFNYASVLGEFTGRNPTESVQLPPLTTIERKIFTKKEWAAFYKELDPHYKPLAKFLLASGLRFGEAAALRRRDVVVQENLVRVRMAWKATADLRGYELGTPKTEKSKRDVHIPKKVMKELVKLMDDLPPGEDQFVFTSHLGKRIRSDKVGSIYFRDAQQRAGITVKITPHVLRHAHISFLLAKGQDLYNVSRRVGHSTPEMIGKRYGHASKKVDIASAAAISKFL